MTELDERDTELLAQRVAAFDAVPGCRVGDYIRFAGGVERRISYIWRDEHDTPFSVQTSAGGSYYLGNGGLSMSGSLFTGIEPETLTDTGETLPGSVWFFHHNRMVAGGGRDATIAFRVFAS